VNSTLQVIRGHEERFDWIENKRLPKKQQEILNTHKIIDPYLENNKESSIVVFNSSSKDTKEDKVLSFHNRSQNYIAIRQELLNDPEEFAKAYISEKALMITGALIGSRSHINYLSKNLITFILLAEEQKNKKVIEEKPEKKHSIEDELSF
jgi:hypothetical protein